MSINNNFSNVNYNEESSNDSSVTTMGDDTSVDLLRCQNTGTSDQQPIRTDAPMSECKGIVHDALDSLKQDKKTVLMPEISNSREVQLPNILCGSVAKECTSSSSFPSSTTSRRGQYNSNESSCHDVPSTISQKIHQIEDEPEQIGETVGAYLDLDTATERRLTSRNDDEYFPENNATGSSSKRRFVNVRLHLNELMNNNISTNSLAPSQFLDKSLNGKLLTLVRWPTQKPKLKLEELKPCSRNGFRKVSIVPKNN